MKIYSKIDDVPRKSASEVVTPGCMVLEGGSFRGLYTGGVLDLLMEEDINLACTVGVSAGALNGFNYAAGQIGRASRFNLSHRHDKQYVGFPAVLHNKGIFGFDILFDDARSGDPLDKKRFDDRNRRFVAVATDCQTGKPVYFEKGICSDIFQGIRASASMPVFSCMVPLDGKKYLDGGCSVNIPLQWALEQGYEKIVVVRTRDKSYRKAGESKTLDHLQRVLYHRYPQFLRMLRQSAERYNAECDLVDELERQGRIFVIAPSEPVTVTRLEKDMEKLGELYWKGQQDAQTQLEALRKYLG